MVTFIMVRQGRGSSDSSGLTGGFNGDRRVEFIIPEEHRKAGVGHYIIEASCNGMFGQDGEMAPNVGVKVARLTLA